MTNANVEKQITELKELEIMAKELAEEIDSIKDELKAEMINRNTEELMTGAFIIRYTQVTSKRFDSKAFKETHTDLYNRYTKESTSMRFTIQ